MRPIDSAWLSGSQISDAYRKRYAAYIASVFNISVEAAISETDRQLIGGHRPSNISESELERRDSF